LRLLLDTVGLLCAAADPNRMTPRVRELIADEGNQVLVSAASAWEMSTKFRLGKLDQTEALVQNWERECEHLQIEELAVSAAHALRGGSYAIDHRDPFDRLICAQGDDERSGVRSLPCQHNLMSCHGERLPVSRIVGRSSRR